MIFSIRFRILVGPCVMFEYVPHPSQSLEERRRLLGAYVETAVSEGIKKYGPTHEVRITAHQFDPSIL